ncbi:multidrug ABC transporter ATPase [Halogeometricum borinquense DSM 11551]|uniref:ABC-type multidrug transport system, ATPase component n=2 Tax=Halogeometricum borinquense TaxID=60847 RepID=E4NQ03_HALBP|nr:ABC transporter ATP-binding protein [Halogeometricum borinquense]ADQ67748.1 ABC-type multidrug transport system, ATPase component [Halogeometricum borinquense DSM 11551]ELY23570.1 multidrug ABC transporter ATPase [Halogeometricum borinquense DSM 11551]RYJ13313.1 ABC transporter ATP-binding protein [Halogeometricum borinquense]
MDEVLVADDVRKSYGDRDALSGVSLSVSAGEVFGLIGPNGAGKTTLVRALTGTTPVEGHVSVLGTSPTAVERSRIGLLPQSFSPAARLTARELVSYYAGLYDEARDPESVLADVGLAGDDANTWYEDLSGGQQRRACVAAALVNDPDVLFLDEPTTGIDPAGRRSLWNLLDDLAAGGTTVFLTSHSMAEVERLADRVGLLNAGELVAVGSPSELVAAHGGDSRLEVETESLPESATEALNGHFDAAARDGRLVFEGLTPRDIGDAVDALDDAGIAYDTLTWTQPDLEDVYLSLTGEAFEDNPSFADAPMADGGGNVGQSARGGHGGSRGGDEQ